VETVAAAAAVGKRRMVPVTSARSLPAALGIDRPVRRRRTHTEVQEEHTEIGPVVVHPGVSRLKVRRELVLFGPANAGRREYRCVAVLADNREHPWPSIARRTKPNALTTSTSVPNANGNALRGRRVAIP